MPSLAEEASHLSKLAGQTSLIRAELSKAGCQEIEPMNNEH